MTYSGAIFLAIFCVGTIAGQALENYQLPDPEELYQAFEDGLIEYEDYQLLLEISNHGATSREDSLLVEQFYLVYQDSNFDPLFAIEDTGDSNIVVLEKPPEYSHDLVFRQSHRLRDETDVKRLIRYKATLNQNGAYLEMGENYSGDMAWDRRYFTYQTIPNNKQNLYLQLGNYSYRFGSGLVFGYHGRLLTKSAESEASEDFLFPHYGGSNGLLIQYAVSGHNYTGVIDIDRNEEFRKYFSGVAIPIIAERFGAEIIAAYGRITDRVDQTFVDAAYLSIYGAGLFYSGKLEYEMAAARAAGHYSMALAGKWRKSYDFGNLKFDWWHYDNNYHAWFSGGPSSRRYRTIELDEIDFSFRDRFSGESGGVITGKQRLNPRLVWQSGLLYAWRGADDNRLDGRTELTQKLNSSLSISEEWQYRTDDMLSDDDARQRVYLKLLRHDEISQIRMVIGYNFDRNSYRNDYLAYCEGKLRLVPGEFNFLIKFDRLQWKDLKNNYLYAAVGLENNIGSGFYTYVKYSYRYRRESESGTYGELRWDLNWRM